MGYTRHDAIIVTAWDEKHIKLAHEKAKELGMFVSDIVKGAINGYETFLIAPDGSKEGWAESSKGDEQRAAFIQWAQESMLYLEWIAVNFGGDDSHLASITDYAGKEAEEDS